jgi:hypothetical protein
VNPAVNPPLDNPVTDPQLTIPDSSDSGSNAAGVEQEPGTDSERLFTPGEQPFSPGEDWEITAERYKDAGIPVFDIGGAQVPLIGMDGVASWALIDLLCALAGLTIALILLYRRRKSKEAQEAEELLALQAARFGDGLDGLGGPEGQGLRPGGQAALGRLEGLDGQTGLGLDAGAGFELDADEGAGFAPDVEDEYARGEARRRQRRRRIFTALTVILAAAGVAVLLLTQSFSSHMTLLDKWAALHAALLAAEAIFAWNALAAIRRKKMEPDGGGEGTDETLDASGSGGQGIPTARSPFSLQGK